METTDFDLMFLEKSQEFLSLPTEATEPQVPCVCPLAARMMRWLAQELHIKTLPRRTYRRRLSKHKQRL